MAVTALPQIDVSSDSIDSWEEYWLAVATTIARKSKDPNCRVGAAIVQGGLLVATGFNGLARDVYDDPALLSDAKEKLKMICHAEHNAICNAARAGVRLLGATIYVTKFPCLRCCNAIVQAGIQRIYTHDDRFWKNDPDDEDHTRKQSLLRQAGIKVVAPFHPVYMAKRVAKRETASAATMKVALIATPVEPTPKSVPPGDGSVAQTSAAPRNQRKRPPSKPPTRPKQQALWPAREAIAGGKKP